MGNGNKDHTQNGSNRFTRDSVSAAQEKLRGAYNDSEFVHTITHIGAYGSRVQKRKRPAALEKDAISYVRSRPDGGSSTETIGCQPAGGHEPGEPPR